VSDLIDVFRLFGWCCDVVPGTAFQSVIVDLLVQQRSYSFLNVALGMVGKVGYHLLTLLIEPCSACGCSFHKN